MATNMKRKLQVFISSTFTDMKDERQATVEAILRAGHIPAGMELFAASDSSQMETIRNWIDDSDVFVLVLGGRWGSVEKRTGKSYVQLEYEYALSKNKPYFAAVIEHDQKKAKVQEMGPDAIETKHGDKFEKFTELVTSKICRFYTTLDSLKLIVYEGISELDRRKDLIGWVRGDSVIDPKPLLEDIARLQAENNKLSEQLKSAGASAGDTVGGAAGIVMMMSPEERDIISKCHDELALTVETGAHNLTIWSPTYGLLIETSTRRERLKWSAAIDKLIMKKLISRSGVILSESNSKKTEYLLTALGYEVFDLCQTGF